MISIIMISIIKISIVCRVRCNTFCTLSLSHTTAHPPDTRQAKAHTHLGNRELPGAREVLQRAADFTLLVGGLETEDLPLSAREHDVRGAEVTEGDALRVRELERLVQEEEDGRMGGGWEEDGRRMGGGWEEEDGE
eukprot:2605295-Rhodomonas_salina.1